MSVAFCINCFGTYLKDNVKFQLIHNNKTVQFQFYDDNIFELELVKICKKYEVKAFGYVKSENTFRIYC